VDPAILALVIALVGNAVSITVVVMSNVSASRREQRRLDREDDRLERQRHDARVRLAREAAWRVIDVQREYYVDFYMELRAASLVIHAAGYAGDPIPPNWQLPAYDSLMRLRVFASLSTYEAAEDAYNALYRWGALDGVAYESDEELEYDSALDAYLVAVRHDLGIEIDTNRLSEADVIR
jgi:hypothetical protein